MALVVRAPDETALAPEATAVYAPARGFRDRRPIGIVLGPPPVSVKLAGAVIDSVQPALALTVALPPPAAYCASGSTLPKSTRGVSSVSCTAARLVNCTVWFCVSLDGGAAMAEPAEATSKAAARPPTSAMRMRDMQVLVRGLRSTKSQGSGIPKKAQNPSSAMGRGS